MNIVVIYGSVRKSRLGIRAAKFVVNKLRARKHKVALIDPLVYKLPLLNKTYKEYPRGKAPVAMKKLASIYKEADAVVVVSGEYNHSIPPALTNLLDHFMEEYFWKPSGIVCYSTGGFGGVRAAMQLRALLPEIGMPTIPSLFPISKVDKSFDENGKDLTGNYDKRIGRFLDELEWYAKACKAQRKKGKAY